MTDEPPKPPLEVAVLLNEGDVLSFEDGRWYINGELVWPLESVH
jgi:hypothetical protein